MKRVILAFLLLILLFVPAAVSFGDVYCSGVPMTVLVGAEGGQEGNLFAVFAPGWQQHMLGPGTDEMAKERLAMAITAISTGYTLVLEYWNYTDCATAIAAHAIANSCQLRP